MQQKMVKDTDQMDLGERYKNDPHFNGPQKNRSCTDVLCLLLFFVFIAAWIGIGLYALSHGDPSMFLVPRDSHGRRCGKDHDVQKEPYLLFHDLTRCLEITTPLLGCDTTQVCVSKCPTDYYHKNINHTSAPQAYCLGTICPDWYLPSEPFENRCVPILSSINNSVLKSINRTMETIKKAVNEIKHAQEVGQNVVEDIMHSWWKILIGVILALFACIIYILMLRWVAAPVIWFSIIGILVALGGGIYFTAQEYKDLKNRYETSKIPNEMKRLKTKRDIWLVALILLSSATFIILLMLIFLRKRIYLAIALIKEGSKAVSSVTASLFFPIFPWILQLGVISYAIVVAMFLTTAANPTYLTTNISDSCSQVVNWKNDMKCDPDKFSQELEKHWAICPNAVCTFAQMETDALYPYLQFYNVVGFFWVTFFISALGEMTLAAVFAQWYWTWKKSQLPFFAVTSALLRTFRYHLGTLAFGSLIITICRMIRVCLEYVDRKLKKYDNELTKAIMCLLKCFFYCLEKFLKFINKNAYIMCAIHGKNFCASAKDAFMLLMRNILRVFVLDKMTDFLFFISSLLLTLGVGAVSYIIFATDIMESYIDNSALHYGIVPVTVIMISTYLISNFFFGVYSMAVDTLFLCFLEDCERNDGSAQKPYYMSKNLMRIFGKKNKAV